MCELFLVWLVFLSNNLASASGVHGVYKNSLKLNPVTPITSLIILIKLFHLRTHTAGNYFSIVSMRRARARENKILEIVGCNVHARAKCISIK